MNKNIIYILLLSSFLYPITQDDIINDMKISKDRQNYNPGEYLTLDFEFNILKDFHIYSSDPSKSPPGGETFIDYEDSLLFNKIYDIVEPTPITKFDQNFNQNTSFHKGNFILNQNIILNDSIESGIYEVVGLVEAIACDPTQCIKIFKDFTFEINIGQDEARNEYLISEPIVNNLSKHTGQCLFSFIIFALGMGFLALLTPCVFPMIPITVSYFTKQGEKENSRPVFSAFIYAIGIIVIFTLLGLILAFSLGAEGAGFIASDPWINLFIASLFIFFAFSLFGYYELQAPSFLRQYSFEQESRGGIIGILFMSLTFTLTSFTCTVQFVGLLLVAASHGEYFWPIVGMLSFATAFASPFFFLALFPQYLSKLPKSGGWLNLVKVSMGFLELAAAFKFISNSDLVWEWGIFSREVVLLIWVLILVLMGIYYLGIIKFPHDSKVEKISLKRLLGFLFCILLSIYFSTGLFNKKIYSGNSNILNIISGLIEAYLPPPESNWIEDLDTGYVIAQKEKKPLLLDFTGYTCTNCRWMEINVFEDERVQNIFDNFILVKLYTDGKEKKHRRYRELEIQRFKTAALPFYVILSPDDEVISTFPGYDPNINNFIDFLNNAIIKFNEE